MLFKVPFPQRLLLPSTYLPFTLISLEDWSLIIINGIDAIKYLQGQLTCDITTLDVNHFNVAAHCNAKGKMLSYLYVFYYHEGIALIQRCSVRDVQITELKKYAVFSKITIIADDEAILLGVAGFQAQSILCRFFKRVPNSTNPVIYDQNTTILYFALPTPRFLLITTVAVLDKLQCTLKKEARFNNSLQWLALDIEAGYPIIDRINSSQFIPQATNVHMLNGISFNKGCYIGQEIIARSHYHGTNKRKLYWLVGKASRVPVTGDSLELKIDNITWRRTGKVLAACRVLYGSIWVQAVLNNNLAPNSLLRIYQDNVSELSIYPLTYVL